MNDGVKSTEGMVILLRGSNGNASLLGWRSKGTMRVCCSARTAELRALDSGLDSALLTKLQLNVILGRNRQEPVKVVSHIDSKILKNSLDSAVSMTEDKCIRHLIRAPEKKSAVRRGRL